MALVSIINKRTAKSKRVMAFIRPLVLFTMQHNIQFKAQHIDGFKNEIADSISRFQLNRFRELAPGAESVPENNPEEFQRFDIESETNRLINCSPAPNTIQAYQRALNALAKFRDSFELDHSFPIPLNHITQFIAYMSCLDMAPSTINNYENLSHLFVVRKMIDGMARSKLKRPDSRLPITIDLLEKTIKILPAFCISRYEAVLFSSAFAVGFFAFLRVGEMTTTCGREGPNHAIKIENVEVSNHNVKIYLESSKTDQLGRGTSIFVARQSDDGICPVKLLQEYLKIRPRISGQLYCHFDGSR
ncbi:Hypothetical predicted protein [Mytilus galloprovincialis]|uniref:Core-binding (CB) domain-containing protein n=1 Tax=Mytilus galloprovincialis TaxID=29158 RepID=A0A8B6FEE2_MYTGA|nr:Hypothetical predicted protein [Mytilus galloprovincialis]